MAEGAGRAVVIGGGFGGIAAALRLSAKGYEVTLVERQQALGGRAQVFDYGGFRHDAGPAMVTAPFLVDELFALHGRRREDYVELRALEPWCRFHYADGGTFEYGGTLEATLEEIRRISPDDAGGYVKLVEHCRSLYEVGFAGIADAPVHELTTTLRRLPGLVRQRADRSIWQMVCHFIRHPKLREALSFHPLLMGVSPFDTPSLHGIEPYVMRHWGAHYPMGGMGALVAALGRLMVEAGIAIRLGESVRRLPLDRGRATGVELASGEAIAADVVVSDCDPMYLYRAMVADGAVSISTRLKCRSRPSLGVFVVYFGSRRAYPGVAQHSVVLAPGCREWIDAIAGGRLPEQDLPLYVHRPTATDPSFAAPGCDSFYALCPVPNLAGGIDWKEEGPRLKERMITALDRGLLPGIAQHIVADFFMTPLDFEQHYLSYAGAASSAALSLAQSAWCRFHNRSESIEGLYLVGAGTHPGPGLPGVLSSAKVVEKLVPLVVATATDKRGASPAQEPR